MWDLVPLIGKWSMIPCHVNKSISARTTKDNFKYQISIAVRTANGLDMFSVFGKTSNILSKSKKFDKNHDSDIKLLFKAKGVLDGRYQWKSFDPSVKLCLTYKMLLPRWLALILCSSFEVNSFAECGVCLVTPNSIDCGYNLILKNWNYQKMVHSGGNSASYNLHPAFQKGSDDLLGKNIRLVTS